MTNIEFGKYVDVYKYVSGKDYEDMYFNKLNVLHIGLLGYSSLTGDAQRILKQSFPDNFEQNPSHKEIWEKFVNNENYYEGNLWISKAPVSIAGALTVTYADDFYFLLKKSIPVQKKELQKVKKLWEELCEVLQLKENNHRAIALIRVIDAYPSLNELEKLIILSRTNFNLMLDELCINAEASSLLSSATRHMPGKSLNPLREFPWLAPKKDKVEDINA